VELKITRGVKDEVRVDGLPLWEGVVSNYEQQLQYSRVVSDPEQSRGLNEPTPPAVRTAARIYERSWFSAAISMKYTR
jgi:hypothetical protein